MQLKDQRYDVGVIVGRFQVPELHEAHASLIEHVCQEHDKVVVFLGLSPLMVTRENPLDFEARKQMILQAFPDVTVLYIRDQWSDKLWTRQLDRMVGDLVTPSQSVVLYGGRDSFVNLYDGRYPVRELEQDVWVSGSVIRKAVSQKSVKKSADFRAGVVWAAYSQYPTVYTTVDVAIFNKKGEILLGRKENEPKYRLIGGFIDPGSETSEQDARREVMEEAGIEITDPIYLLSMNIDDWRYRGEVDKIRTMLFTADYQFGSPKPGDDIAEVAWFPVDMVGFPDADGEDRHVMPNHSRLVAAACDDYVRRVNPDPPSDDPDREAQR